MVTVKEAANTALDFAREFLGDNRVNSLLLEEIELSDTQKEWLVTVSVPRSPAPAPSNSLALMSPSISDLTRNWRDFKIIRVDADNGNPTSIKIRPV